MVLVFTTIKRHIELRSLTSPAILSSLTKENLRTASRSTCFLLPSMFLHPVNHYPMPLQRILRLQHKMPFIRKTQELAFHTLHSRRCKSRKSHGWRSPLVKPTMRDQNRRLPPMRELCRIPFLKDLHNLGRITIIAAKQHFPNLGYVRCV